MQEKDHFWRGIIRSLGLVFGDIGTSPIYTLTVVFLLLPRTYNNVIGILSLIIWTLILLVTVEYAWLAMSLSKKGEGGSIVLREILIPMLKSGKKAAFFTVLSFFAVSLLIGDGVITPAISILSAVEGSLLIPGLENIPQTLLIGVAALIAIWLFSIQRKGTEKVAGAFGPLMVVWFSALFISGLISILQIPSVLKAINPFYGINFILHHGIVGFFVLSEVILCATGGEALYADMGHLGRKPITRAWYFVFIALVTNYLGQGAFLITHSNAKNILFEMIFDQSQILFVPFLILSIIATVIASQAMISGMFSVVFQGITTRIMPLFKVDYTSEEFRTQIYIGTVNWFLLFFVIIIMFVFKQSSNLAAAYGLAVTGTMTITGIVMTYIFFLRKNYIITAMSSFVTLIDLIFLVANFHKIPLGGYWSILIALIPLTIIFIYTSGQRLLYKALNLMPKAEFLPKYNEIYKEVYRIRGSALYFARSIDFVPPYITRTMFTNNIVYEDNIIVSINITDAPYGAEWHFKESPAEGLRIFEIKAGYMEHIDVENIIREAGICEKVIFYGVEDITTENIIWKIFSTIKSLTPSFVQFYKLPSDKLHGIITRIQM